MVDALIDALITAITAADRDGVVAALRGASEAERAAFAAELVPAMVAGDGFGVFKRGADGGLRWVERTGPAGARAHAHEGKQVPVVNLAVLGTATPQQMRRVAWSLSWVDDDAGAAVLLDRNPPWLATWAQWILTTETMDVRWPLVRSSRSREHLTTLKHKAARSLVERAGDPPPEEAQFALAARARRAYRWMSQ